MKTLLPGRAIASSLVPCGSTAQSCAATQSPPPPWCSYPSCEPAQWIAVVKSLWRIHAEALPNIEDKKFKKWCSSSSQNWRCNVQITFSYYYLFFESDVAIQLQFWVLHGWMLWLCIQVLINTLGVNMESQNGQWYCYARHIVGSPRKWYISKNQIMLK